MDDDRKKAMQAALRLLTGRDYTASEIERKLTQRKFSPEDIANTVSECIRSGYVNDASLAERFINAQMRKGYGRHRIRLAMQRKGFPPDLVDRLPGEQVDDALEVETIRALIVKHKRTSKPAADKIKEKQRLFRFLRNRGYSDESIRNALRDEDPDDE